MLYGRGEKQVYLPRGMNVDNKSMVIKGLDINLIHLEMKRKKHFRRVKIWGLKTVNQEASHLQIILRKVFLLMLHVVVIQVIWSIVVSIPKMAKRFSILVQFQMGRTI